MLRLSSITPVWLTWTGASAILSLSHSPITLSVITRAPSLPRPQHSRSLDFVSISVRATYTQWRLTFPNYALTISFSVPVMCQTWLLVSHYALMTRKKLKPPFRSGRWRPYLLTCWCRYPVIMSIECLLSHIFEYTFIIPVMNSDL